MKIDKVIVSVDDSHYQYFWPVVSEVCKKVLGVTPVLLRVGDEDSDFKSDEFGIIKYVKKIEGIPTSTQGQLLRLYGTKYFPNEVCLISDIDMMLFNKEYFVENLKFYNEDSYLILSSDGYDSNSFGFKEKLGFQVYPLCYHAAKGKTFSEILEIEDSFEGFVKKIVSFNQKFDFDWFSDEIYLSSMINSKYEKYEFHKLKRGYKDGFHLPTRIEKYNFPVDYRANEEMRENNKKLGNYDKDKLKQGYYIDCHCVRPYGWYSEQIWEVANIVMGNFENLKSDENPNTKKVMRNDLFLLGEKYNTDKVTHHRYDRIYDKFLESYRNDEVKLFEIGCGGDAASFYMWHEYFPKGKIYAMDISEERTTERGSVFLGDQTKKEDLQRAYEKLGKCDIIIDDGSHHPLHQIETFEFLFDKMLVEGGIYIIEDIECNYWRPGTSIYGYEIEKQNIIDNFSSIPHRINEEFSRLKNHHHISSITYSKNCIIIIKRDFEEIEESKKDYRFNFML